SVQAEYISFDTQMCHSKGNLMSKDEQYSYAFLVILMLLFLFWIVPTQIQDPEGASVSPRFLPIICGVSILFLSLGKLIGSFSIVENRFVNSLENYKILAITLIFLTVSTFLMNWIGFWAGSAVSVLGALWIAEERNWKTMAIYTVSLLVISFALVSVAGIYLR
ncbi:MAG: tripartite tricarboxylate transporter TctB family protein, partial [Chloroflexota bacterium]